MSSPSPIPHTPKYQDEDEDTSMAFLSQVAQIQHSAQPEISRKENTSTNSSPMLQDARVSLPNCEPAPKVVAPAVVVGDPIRDLRELEQEQAELEHEFGRFGMEKAGKGERAEKGKRK